MSFRRLFLPEICNTRFWRLDVRYLRTKLCLKPKFVGYLFESYYKKNQLVRLFSIASLIFLNVNKTSILSFFRLIVIHFSIIIFVVMELIFFK